MQNIEIKKAENPTDLENIFKIRREVFIKEQIVPEDIEIDGLDDVADQFFVKLNNSIIGCARVRFIVNTAKLERIAIVKEYRGKGYGKKLTEFLIDYCKQKNVKEINMHSQFFISDFYKMLGFKKRGKPFFEAGIKHIEMYMKV